jgi:hypothetical protein
MKKQIFNPFLPVYEYIPDGEPHVFGDRVYLFGSHDKEGGDAFCMLDYVAYSASVTDLTDWKYEGVIYRAAQNPGHKPNSYMYAPDVAQGNDGRYYLYFCISDNCFSSPIHVAVCDSPAGSYDFLGFVSNHDGSPFTRCITFDPGLINDNGVIRLYYGWSLAVNEATLRESGGEDAAALREKLLDTQVRMFQKTREDVLAEPEGIMGANTLTLANDMLTVTSEPKRIVPGQFSASGTSFEGHAFFEASSIRKINDSYYFVYSSELSHDLCYATSKYPDKDFVYGGTIISNGDIGLNGRQAKDRLNQTGNNHGSIEYINGDWFVFYHRHTHKSNYSRQACAEKIAIMPNGNIPQVEVSSQGLNGSPLRAMGQYPALIACNLTNGSMPHPVQGIYEGAIPHITHQGDERFITGISNGTLIGYKYFAFNGKTRLRLHLRGEAQGDLIILANDEKLTKIALKPAGNWTAFEAPVETCGTKALYIKFSGEGNFDFISFEFE